jgi:phytoene synthase
LAERFAELDSQVRRADEDRWLASRFAPRAVRQRLVALYAVNFEIARTAQIVSEPAIGAIRLAWWRDAISAACSGASVPGHPALEAFINAGLATEKIGALLIAGIEARGAEFEGSRFSEARALRDYIGATTGGLMRAAVLACDGDIDEPLVENASNAWGLCVMLRQDAGEGACGHEALAAAALEAYQRVKKQDVPAQIFPALGYAALIPLYLDSWKKRTGSTALLRRQVRLIIASATGRL